MIKIPVMAKITHIGNYPVKREYPVYNQIGMDIKVQYDRQIFDNAVLSVSSSS